MKWPSRIWTWVHPILGSTLSTLYLIRSPGRILVEGGICRDQRFQHSWAFSPGLHSEQWQLASRDSQTPDVGNPDCPHPAGGANTVLVCAARALKNEANSCLFRLDGCFIPNQKKTWPQEGSMRSLPDLDKWRCFLYTVHWAGLQSPPAWRCHQRRHLTGPNGLSEPLHFDLVNFIISPSLFIAYDNQQLM